MYARAPPIVGRARRLTDTVGDDTIAAAKARAAAGSLGGAPGGIPAGITAGADDVVNVVTCSGGGLDISRSCVSGSHRVTYAVHTAPGADPGGRTKDNQDAWAVKERLGGLDVMMLGVFDGHGGEGKVVSNYLATNLHRIMGRSPQCKPANLETCCLAAFPETNRALRRTPGVDVTLSGSTAVVALLSGGRLQVANLGDSRAVLGALEPKGGVRAIPLSADHTPMDPQEAARINASGGRIASFMYNDAPLGPPRVWLRDVNVPGLCMTRSFGDSVAASVGVSDTPEVVAHVLKPEDRYLVLMSDGIFEFMDSQEVLDMVHGVIIKEGGSPADAAKKLVREARARWQEEEEDIIDDCTALVAVLTPAAAASAPPPAATIGNAQSSAQRLVSNVAGRLESSLRLGGGNANSSSSNGRPNIVSKPAGPGALGYKRL